MQYLHKSDIFNGHCQLKSSSKNAWNARFLWKKESVYTICWQNYCKSLSRIFDILEHFISCNFHIHNSPILGNQILQLTSESCMLHLNSSSLRQKYCSPNNFYIAICWSHSESISTSIWYLQSQWDALFPFLFLQKLAFSLPWTF